MEKAKVYFSDLRTSPTSNLLDKIWNACLNVQASDNFL